MIAATEVCECSDEEIVKLDYDYYGMDIYSANEEEYAIGIPEEADEAIKQCIRDSLWTFKAEFILKHSRVAETKQIAQAITEMQTKLCEDSNEIVFAIIEDIDEFVKSAVEEDGRGTFLATYDSQEREIEINGIKFLAYRIN